MKVHITQGDHVGKSVIVSWITPDEPGSTTVVYWAETSEVKNSARGIILTYEYFNYTSGFIHHCTIHNLEVSNFANNPSILDSWFIGFNLKPVHQLDICFNQ